MALVEARRRSRIDFRIITYQTEIFTFHAPWKVPETDWYLTASDRAAQAAARRGIRWSKIKAFPYPIRPDFLESRRDRETVALELGLEKDRRTFLFSFGNQGTGMILQYLIALDILGVRLNVIVVAGLNKALHARLASSRTRLQNLNIVPLGYVGNMNELIDASDVCFIKPGPATMMECMHSRKPIIFNVAATPCEQEHANYAVFRGVAKYTDGNPMLFGIAARHFLKDEVREDVARRYDRLALRNGASDRRLRRFRGAEPKGLRPAARAGESSSGIRCFRRWAEPSPRPASSWAIAASSASWAAISSWGWASPSSVPSCPFSASMKWA